MGLRHRRACWWIYFASGIIHALVRAAAIYWWRVSHLAYDMATSAQRIAMGMATGKNAFIRQRLDRDIDVVESFADWSWTIFA